MIIVRVSLWLQCEVGMNGETFVTCLLKPRTEADPIEAFSLSIVCVCFDESFERARGQGAGHESGVG